MWNSINQVLTAIDDFVWGVPLMVFIIAGGILLTVAPWFTPDKKAPTCIKVDG